MPVRMPLSCLETHSQILKSIDSVFSLFRSGQINISPSPCRKLPQRIFVSLLIDLSVSENNILKQFLSIAINSMERMIIECMFSIKTKTKSTKRYSNTDGTSFNARHFYTTLRSVVDKHET